jgi:hypothetical protein
MKKLLLAVLVLSLFAGTTAFALQDKPDSTLGTYWYKLRDGGDPGNYLDYNRVSDQPCLGYSTVICGVYAEQYSGPDINHPNLSTIQVTVFKP